MKFTSENTDCNAASHMESYVQDIMDQTYRRRGDSGEASRTVTTAESGFKASFPSSQSSDGKPTRLVQIVD
jgi:hypothetical protein